MSMIWNDNKGPTAQAGKVPFIRPQLCRLERLRYIGECNQADAEEAMNHFCIFIKNQKKGIKKLNETA